MDRFRSRAAWVGLAVPAVPLVSGLSVVVQACPGGGVTCLGRFVTGAFLVVAAAPTAVVIGPVAAGVSTGPLASALAVVLAVATSAPLWWLAARRVARSVASDERRPWAAFLLRWLGLCGLWFAFTVVVALVSLRLLV